MPLLSFQRLLPTRIPGRPQQNKRNNIAQNRAPPPYEEQVFPFLTYIRFLRVDVQSLRSLRISERQTRNF